MEKMTVRPSGPPILYETAHYRVIVGKLTSLPNAAEEMHIKFIIQDKKHGVIYGFCGHLGMATVAAEQAEKELEEASAICGEMIARKPVESPFPKLDG